MQLFHADFPVTRFAAEGLEHPAVLDIFELPFFFFFFHEIMLVFIIDLVFFSRLDRASKNIYPITRTLPIVLSHFTALSWCWTKYFLVLSLSYF